MEVPANDTVRHTTAPTVVKTTVPVTHSWKKSTAQVLRELPDSATPWQQDSAVQAYFRPGEDNHYSNRPDTLGLPGRHVDPQYAPYPKEVWMSPQALHKTLHPNDTIAVAPIGMMADPMPYRPGGDTVVSSLLIACPLLMVVAVNHSRTFILKQTRSFFYTAKARTTQLTEQPQEVWYQVMLGGVTLVLLAIAMCCGLLASIGYQPQTTTPHTLMAVCIALVIGWFVAKALLFALVNWVFFGRKKILQWNRDCLLLLGGVGIALLPMLYAHIFGALSWKAGAVYLFFIVIMAEILFIYKSFVTFFHKASDYLQIILYFCALEMMPLVGLAGITLILHESLRINF